MRVDHCFCLAKVEQCGLQPKHFSTLFHFFIPSCHQQNTECAFAGFDMLVGTRGAIMKKEKQSEVQCTEGSSGRQRWCGLGRCTLLSPQRILRTLCGCFDHWRNVLSGRCVVDLLQTITAMFLGSSHAVMQDAMVEVLKVSSHLNLAVYVDDIKIHV